MTLYDRMKALQQLFIKLENTPSRNEKEQLINSFCKDSELSEDLTYCLEILVGKYKLGYRLLYANNEVCTTSPNVSLRTFCSPLYAFTKSQSDMLKMSKMFSGYLWFLAPLFNRDWRLGINNSILEKDIKTAPMLAKKFDPNKIPEAKEYYITQKLDGNRCCAFFNWESNSWQFVSRAGKTLKVSFNMSSANKMFVYDGEILSRDQILNPSQENFNKLSGLVNSKEGDKSSLVYMIFDIKEDLKYADRRQVLNCMMMNSENVQILPLIEKCSKQDLPERASYWLHEITSKGGEGIMINLGERSYERKRTDALLKYKEVFTMDMKVIDIIPGTGKNEGLVGSLNCVAKDGDITYTCMVGSGLEDSLRQLWASYPNKILNKIVEVAYFSSSRASNRNCKVLSLRFPRFVRVRDDKTDTSVD